jgi:hypothetical protein
MSLTQDEVKQLFELEKYQVKNVTFDFPLSGDSIEIELQNDTTGRIKFIADIDNSNQFVKKAKIQLRYKKIYVIRRIDFNGNHKNPPDKAPISIFDGWENYVFNREDHIHFYIEGYGERWALPITAFPEIGINSNDELFEKVTKFFKYCNVQDLKIRKLLDF